MRWAIFSDVHANLEAMEAFLEDVQGRGVDRYVFLGDAVGYGADPEACCRLLAELPHLVAVMGNHDAVVAGKDSGEDFRRDALEVLRWTRDRLSETARTWLSRWPLVAEAEGMTFAHATSFRPESWEYVYSLKQAQACFEASRGRVTFLGHTHWPLFLVQDPSRRVHPCMPGPDGVVRDVPEARMLVNVGSLGQPRDRDPRGSYVLYDAEAGVFQLVRLPYDTEKASRKIRDAGLPGFFADRLIQGV